MKNLVYLCFILIVISCSKGDAQEETPVENNELQEVYSKIYGASSITLEGNYVVIKVDGTPDHKSPYYEASSSYTPYDGSNDQFHLNPNRINSFDFTYKIPLNPREASNKNATSLGSIGVALNGVAIYNQYAGPNNQPLTREINSFDQFNGHPQQQGVYHYHIEPLYLTENQGKDVLLGFLLDGFPVYGPFENGEKITNSDLDAYHGHSHATEDYPQGTYHYHITENDPYINGNGYFGSPGTVTQ